MNILYRNCEESLLSKQIPKFLGIAIRHSEITFTFLSGTKKMPTWENQNTVSIPEFISRTKGATWFENEVLLKFSQPNIARIGYYLPYSGAGTKKHDHIFTSYKSLGIVNLIASQRGIDTEEFSLPAFSAKRFQLPPKTKPIEVLQTIFSNVQIHKDTFRRYSILAAWGVMP